MEFQGQNLGDGAKNTTVLYSLGCRGPPPTIYVTVMKWMRTRYLPVGKFRVVGRAPLSSLIDVVKVKKKTF